MSVTNELRHLALYLDELIDTGNGLEVGSSLYEQVQYNNSIIPRLYLMITVTGINEHIINPYRQIMENSSRNFSEIFIFRVVRQAVLLENSSKRRHSAETNIS